MARRNKTLGEICTINPILINKSDIIAKHMKKLELEDLKIIPVSVGLNIKENIAYAIGLCRTATDELSGLRLTCKELIHTQHNDNLLTVDFVRQRLNNIPILFNFDKYKELVFSLHKENKSTEIISIYTSDLVPNIKLDYPIFNEIEICKLQAGNILKIDNITIESGYNHASYKSAVKSSYKILDDAGINSEESSNTNISVIVTAVSAKNPESAKLIFIRACDNIIYRLQDVKENITNCEKTTKLQLMCTLISGVLQSKLNILNETSTLGNIITYELYTKYKDIISLVNYNFVQHNSRLDINFNIKSQTDNTKIITDKYIDVINTSISTINKIKNML